MRGQFAESLLLLCLLCAATTLCLGLNKLNSQVRCIENERQASLKFKQDLQDDYSLLSSWGSHEEDCCKWKGIEYSNQTGHVVTLDLQSSKGALETFEFLSDMSLVNLSKAINWMDKLNKLPSLLHLSLSDCELSMSVLPVLSNANSSSPLSFLSLFGNNLNSSVCPWLYRYTNSLVVLDISGNNLEGLIPKNFGNMVALVCLDLS
ncbi:receptor-like protein EIX2 [Corylus avellana]|uniref:receptor-like protein EIX2 n=1 Tax=Corylus avellana TaxID=13451 RepID=UPI00286AE1C6|nr:receptor-like protein EIX2 [Corylus avellana]